MGQQQEKDTPKSQGFQLLVFFLLRMQFVYSQRALKRCQLAFGCVE